MRQKSVFGLAEIERRLRLLAFSCAHTTATQLYTVHALHPFLADYHVRRGAPVRPRTRGGFLMTEHMDRSTLLLRASTP